MARTAIVVGGSLTGLAAACVLAREAFKVTVFERALNPGAEGAGIGIHRDQLSEVTGFSPFGDPFIEPLPVITTNRDSTTYQSVYRWLRDCVARFPSITVHNGSPVIGVGAQGGKAIADTGNATFGADLLIGADGRNSVVRRFVAPDEPEAGYAGYALWRGILAESELPAELFSKQTPPVQVFWSGPYRLVAYLTPGFGGETAVGERAVSWAWYDAEATNLLQATGCIDGKRVIRTLRPDEVSYDVKIDLQTRAAQHWQEPWRQIILATLTANRCFVTPIAEYLPPRLVRDEVAILGDAAHVVSPMTGAGLSTGLDDVIGLHHALSAKPDSIVEALKLYESRRIRAARALATSSMRWSHDYLRAGRGA